VLSIYTEIIVGDHLLSNSPNKIDNKNIMQGKEKKYKETQQYILFTIKYMLEANINFYIKNLDKSEKKTKAICTKKIKYN